MQNSSLYKKLELFYYLKSHLGVKKIGGEIQCRFVVLQSIFEACGSKKLLSSETCTSVSVTREVSFEARQCDMHHYCWASEVELFDLC